MTNTSTSRKARLTPGIPATLAMMALLGTGLSACGSAEAESTTTGTQVHAAAVDAHQHVTSSQIALGTAMRVLWAQHMEWTYATIAAFAAGTDGLDATLARLLRNQRDIGDAVRSFYGDAGADALTALLEEHIKGAVPILVAAKAGNEEDLNAAVTAWYANAEQIAGFLADANPSWDRSGLEAMMKGHIDQTLTYATAQLQGRYAESIRAYDEAETHMHQMADMLTTGLVEQFPKKFRK